MLAARRDGRRKVLLHDKAVTERVATLGAKVEMLIRLQTDPVVRDQLTKLKPYPFTDEERETFWAECSNGGPPRG